MFSIERTIQFIAPVVCLAVMVFTVSAFAEPEPNLADGTITIGSIARSITYIYGQPQNDYRVDINHACFRDSRIRFYDDDQTEPGISNHSTAISSILIGFDPNASLAGVGTFTYQGVLPQARLDVFEFWHFVTEYVFFQKTPNVDVITMSLGSAFDDWWSRGIEAMAQNFGLLIVAGIGNGAKAFDPPLYPAAAANVLGVGVVNSVTSPNNLIQFTLPDANHSSTGPTDDDRCKPDIVAGGNYLAAVAAEPNLYELTGDYSSYAAPVVAGVAGILIQKAKSDPNLLAAISPAGGNCVLKSILMTTATKLPGWHKGTAEEADDNEYPLDFNQGAGMLNAQAALRLLTTIGQWDNNILQARGNSQNVYPITLNNQHSEVLTATLVWNRFYENKYPFEPLPAEDVDFRLELWATDFNEPNEPVLVDFSDSPVDNVEHIYYQIDDRFDNYELVVTTAEALQSNKPSRYALSWQIVTR